MEGDIMEIISTIALILIILMILGIISLIVAWIKGKVDKKVIFIFLPFFAGILCGFVIKYRIIGLLEFYKWLFGHFFN